MRQFRPFPRTAIERLTPRRVLSHTGDLPNWRNAELPLETHFNPGERFSYSGQGFVYLQKSVEAITGERMHDLVERLVLRPFGMDRSSFVWDWRLPTRPRGGQTGRERFQNGAIVCGTESRISFASA
ncbi:MAG TPA: serine hydrolase [Acetobacteraceae bacterium]|jgi:CubicO group peptidase (beta-lactamase class C family)|nr:serine hydrolase [Acetobacteraceae bacterium]